jgi:ribose transport system substrate-binding protein
MRNVIKIVVVASLTLSPYALTSAHADGEKVAVMTKNLTNPYFQTFRVAAETAARSMHATAIQYTPTKADNIGEQLSQIEDVITKRPNAIVFIPVDNKAMSPAVGKINAAGIPVVNATDRSENGKFVAFVGSDDYNLGLATARYLFKSIDGKGTVIALEGVRGAVTASERFRGFKQALVEFPGIKLMASQPGNYLRLQGLQVTENMLQTYPKLDAIWAANDAMAMGAVEALEGANRKAKIVGINGSPEAVEAIKAGKLLATGDYNGFGQGCISTIAAIRHLRKMPVPANIVFPADVIDRSNYQGKDMPDNKRSCPKWEDVVKS